MAPTSFLRCFFFFNDTATTEIYTLSLHDALPISGLLAEVAALCLLLPLAALRLPGQNLSGKFTGTIFDISDATVPRSEEHTSELQSQSNLVCRLLLEKKNKIRTVHPTEIWSNDSA